MGVLMDLTNPTTNNIDKDKVMTTTTTTTTSSRSEYCNDQNNSSPGIPTIIDDNEQPPQPPSSSSSWRGDPPLPPSIPPPLSSTSVWSPNGGGLLIPGSSHLHLTANDLSAAPLCAGCRLRILDKYYLSAVEQKWHTSCLKCSECGVELENQISCFEKDGQIFCKDDYLRIYANNRTCSRCLAEVVSTDLVIKARHCLFHVECFRCATCDVLLQKGDLYGMYDDVLYCKQHFEHLHQHHQHHHQQESVEGFHHGVGGGGGGAFPGESPDSFSMENGGGGWPGGYPPPPPQPGNGLDGSTGNGDWYPSPLHEYGSMDFGFDNNNEPCLKKRRGRKKRKIESFAAAVNGYLDAAAAASGVGGNPTGPGSVGGFPPPGLDGSMAGQSKTKRARTSFKHHQLRIMRGHFQMNQNPDSRELKHLSQKTGLDKKVLQVWFQNARAKWRRVNANSGSVPPGTNLSDPSTMNMIDDPGDSDSTTSGLPQ